MKILLVIMILLFVASGIFYYNLTGNVVREKSEVFVVRAVDGDTLEIAGGEKIRLLGVNTPEKGMLGYKEAKEFLKLLENRTAGMESAGADKYGRILAHVFIGNEHINEEILEKGLGSLYYYGQDEYYEKLKIAEEFARMNNLGIWKESKNKNCISLLELKYVEDGERCTNKEVLKLQNLCDEEISITFKDDATHIYKEKINTNTVFFKNFSCIWNDDGDSLFAWDTDGLVLFYRYP